MNWSQLNPDLLRLIAKKLGDITNFIRFRVVCKHWRSSVLPCDLPPQLPWFPQREQHWNTSSKMKFYSLYSNKTHTLHVPAADGKCFEGALNKHILFMNSDFTTSVLINPLTQSQISVPYTPHLIYHAKDSCNHEPNLTENNITVAIFMTEENSGKRNQYFLCLTAVGEWTKVDVTQVHNCFLVTLYKGKLFIWDSERAVTIVIDITTRYVVSVVSSQAIRFDYLIQACDLLGVVRLYDVYDSDIPFEECRFKVYRLEQGDKSPSWVEMTEGIGDLMLFLGRYGGFCLKESDFDGFKGNNIYFWKWKRSSGFFIGRYDLEEDKTEMLILTKGNSFFPDDTWLVPSLCKAAKK